MKIVSPTTMRELDRRTIEEAGVPDERLMEQAADAAFRELLRTLPLLPHTDEAPSFCILTGKGNNAGDGFVIARRLAEAGWRTSLLAASPLDTLTGTPLLKADMLPDSVTVNALAPEALGGLPRSTVLIDAMLGTGIQGPLRSPYDALVPAVNRSGLPVVAVDLPSGLNADTGDVATDAVEADLTITMALPKSGLLRGEGPARCGMLRVVDIGIPASFVAEAPSVGEAVFEQDMRVHFPRRPAVGHKRTFGSLLVVGGALSYAGAPMLAGVGALRAGTGLVTVALPWAAARVAPRRFASPIVVPVGADQSRFLDAESVDEIRPLLERADAVVFGPGVGDPAAARPVLDALLDTGLPLLVDADGLRSLATLNPDDLARRPAPLVLTPHPGEMRDLLAGFDLPPPDESEREQQALRVAERVRAHVLLKGKASIVASPNGRSAINTSGTTALATAGTGDVLAGMIGGFLAQGLPPRDACCCGAFLHGLAGECSRVGTRGLTADDLLDLIPEALHRCTPFA